MPKKAVSDLPAIEQKSESRSSITKNTKPKKDLTMEAATESPKVSLAERCLLQTFFDYAADDFGEYFDLPKSRNGELLLTFDQLETAFDSSCESYALNCLELAALEFGFIDDDKSPLRRGQCQKSLNRLAKRKAIVLRSLDYNQYYAAGPKFIDFW